MRPTVLSRIGIRPTTGHAIALFVALFALTACTTPFDISGERIPQPGPEWGVVIGSMMVQSEKLPLDKPVNGRDSSPATYEFDIVQIQPGDPDGRDPYAARYALNATAGEERTFIARLRPGQYLITAFREVAMMGFSGDLDVVFTVAPGEIHTIGRLRVELPRRAGSGKPYRFAVEHAREATLAQVSKQHADLAKAAVDDPMQVRLRPAP